jgi:hypothetical protein
MFREVVRSGAVEPNPSSPSHGFATLIQDVCSRTVPASTNDKENPAVARFDETMKHQADSLGIRASMAEGMERLIYELYRRRDQRRYRAARVALEDSRSVSKPSQTSAATSESLFRGMAGAIEGDELALRECCDSRGDQSRACPCLSA